MSSPDRDVWLALIAGAFALAQAYMALRVASINKVVEKTHTAVNSTASALAQVSEQKDKRIQELERSLRYATRTEGPADVPPHDA